MLLVVRHRRVDLRRATQIADPRDRWHHNRAAKEIEHVRRLDVLMRDPGAVQLPDSSRNVMQRPKDPTKIEIERYIVGRAYVSAGQLKHDVENDRRQVGRVKCFLAAIDSSDYPIHVASL